MFDVNRESVDRRQRRNELPHVRIMAGRVQILRTRTSWNSFERGQFTQADTARLAMEPETVEAAA